MKNGQNPTERWAPELTTGESALRDAACSSSDPLRLTLEQTITILAEAPAVIVEARGASDDRVVQIDDLWSVTGEDDSTLLTLAWESEGRKYALEFEERDNRKVLAAGSSLFLVSTEGEKERLTVLMPRDITSMTNVQVHTPLPARADVETGVKP